MRNMKKYLLWFANENIDFRKPEIDSLLSLLNIKMKFIKEPQNTEPYWIVQFDTDDDVKKLAERSVSLKMCLELWAYAETTSELHDILKNHQKSFYEQNFKPEKSFKIKVETFCKHFSQQEKIQKIEQFDYLPVEGSVKLKDPDVCLQYIEYYGTIPTSAPEEPYCVFFGKLITTGLRQLIQTLSLKSRKFIGNTSMDPQLSLLMANQAKVKNGDVVLDPFVGSGSLLIAAAQFGGYVFGTDINYLMLHGKTKPSRIKQKVRDKNESIKANMEQYKIVHQYLDVLVNDFSCSFWRDNFKFDSIVTDPPYGIREATEKIGTDKQNYIVNEEHLPTHIPSKIEYGIARIYGDLISFSLKHLKLGGRLVCWFPIFREDYTEEGLPSHPCLKLVANSEQVLSKLTSRRLLTYEKIQEPSPGTEINIDKILDFRDKYFETREESRNEKRIREAKLREENRIKYLSKK
ncbi:tRNA (guanine(10)-N2)-methyltransferase homolog [Coccinella septempunctata]|uniref:tRNA (guanine(10)-N2)-methyltransferase homolog n=1 Tax=Coccinella septempunctata TaxID=41139 RepID=UPI001D065E1E|nr:tRNA (guanine(10)-N2)-methyltransferase homolog [Coccinella septempunctata]